MTEPLIPGKRYRYTVEGTAHRSLVHERLVLDLGKGYVLPSALFEGTGPGTVEMLPDPLPTTPGSVVRDDDGDAWILRSTGGWDNTSGGRDIEVTHMQDNYKITVLFDAGVTP